MKPKTVYSLNGMEWEKSPDPKWKWELTKDVYWQTGILPKETINFPGFTLYVSGLLILYAGFKWDGATFSLDTWSNARGSAIHDVGCFLVNLGLLPANTMPIWNDLYIELCEADGMPWWRRKFNRQMLKLYWKRRINKLYEQQWHLAEMMDNVESK
jgi:hypothetical protein